MMKVINGLFMGFLLKQIKGRNNDVGDSSLRSCFTYEVSYATVAIPVLQRAHFVVWGLLQSYFNPDEIGIEDSFAMTGL